MGSKKRIVDFTGSAVKALNTPQKIVTKKTTQ